MESKKCVFNAYSCDKTHQVIYDDFSVTQNRRREMNVPYLKANGRKSDTLPIKASVRNWNFLFVLLPFLMIRWWSGDPEQEYLDVTTSRLVSTSGPTCTNGQQRKNCLNPRRNLTNEDKDFDETFVQCRCWSKGKEGKHKRECLFLSLSRNTRFLFRW